MYSDRQTELRVQFDVRIETYFAAEEVGILYCVIFSIMGKRPSVKRLLYKVPSKYTNYTDTREARAKMGG